MRALAIGCLAAVVVAGCGHDKDERLPAACTKGPLAVVQALDKAPAQVTLGGTPISQCFNRGASGDDVQILGTILLAAAQQLGDHAQQRQPGAALKLGYLVGAAKRGNKRNNGVADELVRRLEAESAGVSAAQRADYARGLKAGAAQG
jgi:hypothetical protein